MMTAAYLETLSTFSPSVLAEACDTFRRRSTRFAPSSGEIYDRCAEINHKQIQSRKQLAPPDLEAPKYSQEHREEMLRRMAALLAELKSGANFNPHYGRVR